MGGVGRATEVEEDIDPAVARAALDEPDTLLTAGSALIDDLLRYKARSQACLCFHEVRSTRHPMLALIMVQIR